MAFDVADIMVLSKSSFEGHALGTTRVQHQFPIVQFLTMSELMSIWPLTLSMIPYFSIVAMRSRAMILNPT